MNYTISQLKIFLKVVEFTSITKAADELNLTQPAVSIQLKNFQKYFKFPLTEIINKKLYVTEFGLEIAVACENILNEIEIINYKSKGYNNNYTGKLKISIVSTGKYIMPYYLSSFLNEYPDVDLLMDVTNKSKVIASIEKNEIDFGLISILPDNLNFIELELMDNHLYLVGNKEIAEELNLSMINVLKKEFNCIVGYSGHERGVSTTVAAVVLGAKYIERHLTLDRAMWGSDHAASLEPQGFTRLVRDIRIFEQAIGNGVKQIYPSEIPYLEKLRRIK